MEDKTLIAEQTTQAIAYMHSLRPPMIHRDVKPPNVLVSYQVYLMSDNHYITGWERYTACVFNRYGYGKNKSRLYYNDPGAVGGDTILCCTGGIWWNCWKTIWCMGLRNGLFGTLWWKARMGWSHKPQPAFETDLNQAASKDGSFRSSTTKDLQSLFGFWPKGTQVSAWDLAIVKDQLVLHLYIAR